MTDVLDWTPEQIDARRNWHMADVPVLPGIGPGELGQPAELPAALFTMLVAAAPARGSAAAMVAAERALVGVREQPLGSNYAPPITPWYGIGNASWCDECVSYAADKSGNAAAVGGKFAYCPAHTRWFLSQGRWKYGAGDLREGDVVFYRWSGPIHDLDADHVGVVLHVYADGSFLAGEGNHNDVFAIVHRDATYVAGRGRPNYNAQGDDMPIRTSLSIDKAQPLKWGEFVPLIWGTENADPKDAHGKGELPGYVAPVSSWADFDASVRVEGLAEGDEYQLRYEVHDWANGASKGDPWSEIHADAQATNGAQFVPGSCSKGLTKGQHCYISVAVFPSGGDAQGRPAPRATAGRVTVRQDQ